ncbi:TonB-dependent receptor [Sphingomonas prati]|uniref:Iron complex outermembrane receptor protein n=1 Tax=Sphingomonas prati TaxID=1843237 RepID=A0A7W9F0Z6_9SPHN|nr:TonB-dependent receptor [Sphingomonas prati]MBB5728778.1 iron complex outermembrane receptor protein [Sphingomonas prati]GGE87611.1 TonB-dependent receptor [Sphingomonas prati]
MIRAVSSISLGALALVLATPALAQTAPATADAQVQTDAAATAAPTASNDGLQDIVVTATKRETNLQKTPISISVLGAQALADRHVQSLYDLADGAVPGLRVATFEARQSALTIGIRGIVPLDANQPAREQGVGIYVDGVYIGRQHGLNAALFDVERIEVLKGPQGTLFGRNTEGGALSIVTKAPSGKFGLRATGGIGNYGAYNGDIHLDLPEVAGLSFKLDLVKQSQDATTKNPLEGQTGWNYYNRQGLRAAVRWKPTSTITNDFAFDIAKDKNSPFYSQLLNANPNGCVAGSQAAVAACTLPGTAYTSLTGTVKSLLPGVVVNGDSRMKTADIGVPQQPSIDKTHGFTNNLRWHVSDALELRSITAWRGVDATQWDNSGGAHRVPVVTLTAACTAAAPCAFSRYSLADLKQDQFSQELQAVGTVGAVDYVAGLYYFNEHVQDDAATPNSTGAIATLNAAGQVTGATYTTIPFCTGQTVATDTAFIGSAAQGCSIDRASEVHSKSYAAYGQATWNATDLLHITIGGRYTHDEKQGVLHISRNVNYDTNTAAATAAGYQPLDKTWNRFNPTATVAYDVTPNVHAYAKYATGYRSGGASSRTQNYQPFGPEDVKSYEIGLKNDLFDHRVRLNLAGYIMDRKNSQVDISSIQPFNGSSFNNLVTINAPGITKIRGIEADLTVNPLEGLTLGASYAYTYTHIPRIPITYTAGGQSTTVLQQFYIVYTPRNAVSGTIDYALPLGDSDTKLRFHLDGNYAQATQAFDQFATKADSSFIVNGRVGLADIAIGSGHTFGISAWARNLFDEQYIFRRDPSNSLPGAPTTNVSTGSISNILGDYGNYNAPRTFGLEGTIKF